MKIKQKQLQLTVGSLYVFAAILSMFALNLIRNDQVSAAAKSCSQLYSAPAVASQAAKDKAVELRKACNKGYNTNKCNDIKASKHATKKEREKACQKGRDYRKENPPEPDPEGEGTEAGDCGGVKTSIIKCDQDNKGGIENNAVFGILNLVISILTGGVVLVAIGGFVYGAILYTTAESNASQVTKAKETIFNVALGLVLFAVMWAFLQFIIPGGVFG